MPPRTTTRTGTAPRTRTAITATPTRGRALASDTAATDTAATDTAPETAPTASSESAAAEEIAERVESQTLNLQSLLQEAAQRISDPTQLTPEEVLGLSSNEVRRLRSAQNTAVSRGTWLPAAASHAWDAANRVVDRAVGGNTYFLRLEARGQQAVARRVIAAIDSVASARDIRLVFEECPLADDGSLIATYSGDDLSESYLHLRVADNRTFSGTTRIGRRAAGRDPATPESGERLVRVGDTVVAQIDENGRGARLFAHPFLGPQGALTSAALADRKETFTRVLEAIVVALPERQQNEGNEAQEAPLRDAVATLDLLPGFVRAVGDQTATRRRQLVQRRTNAENEVNRLRQELMTMTRDKVNIDAEYEALDGSAAAASMERLTTALVQINRIRSRLSAVRNVTLATGNNSAPSIHVDLQPLVLAHNGTRFLFDKLSFTLPLSGNSHVPQWDTIRNSAGSPHPHVATTGNTCWGQADGPLRNALARKDFAAAVMHIVGWASIYNNSSPYVRLDANAPFPRTTLPTGWHPELPLGI